MVIELKLTRSEKIKLIKSRYTIADIKAVSNEVPKIVNTREGLAKKLHHLLNESAFRRIRSALGVDLLQCAIDKVNWEEVAQSLLDQLKDIKTNE